MISNLSRITLRTPLHGSRRWIRRLDIFLILTVLPDLLGMILKRPISLLEKFPGV